MKGSLLFIIAAGWLIGGIGIVGAQVIWTGNPTADAFVTNGPSNNLSGNNYGAAGAVGVSGSAAARSGSPKGIFDSLIKFDFAGARNAFDTAYGAGQWGVQSITLRLTTTSTLNAIFNDNSSGDFSITWIQNDSWVEGTGNPMVPTVNGVTYTSFPSFSGLVDQIVGTFSFNAATGGADGFNIIYSLTPGSGLLGDIAAGSLGSLEFLPATSGVSYLFNSENFTTASRRPLLTIVAVPEPSAWHLLVAGCVVLASFVRMKVRHEQL